MASLPEIGANQQQSMAVVPTAGSAFAGSLSSFGHISSKNSAFPDLCTSMDV